MKRKALVKGIRYSFISLTGLFLFIIISGYLLSDDLYFRNLIAKHSIESSEDVFEYFKTRNNYPDGEPAIRGCTPRYLLNVRSADHGLYCDEGAVVMATMVKILGYETRLLDLLDAKGKSRHTVLETRANDSENWFIYDTLKESSHHTRGELPRWTKSYRIRKFPRTYNFFIQHNYYLKKAALLIRGIPG